MQKNPARMTRDVNQLAESTEPLSESIELPSSPLTAAIDGSVGPSQEGRETRESPRRDADDFEESRDRIAETALRDSPGCGTSVPNRQRIGRQNDPRAAAVLARRAVRCRIELPIGKIHIKYEVHSTKGRMAARRPLVSYFVLIRIAARTSYFVQTAVR
jgi:hypothetical protein